MTDKEKLDATRAEIHRLVDVRGYDKEMANALFAFMDSLPNEPVSEIWHNCGEKPKIGEVVIMYDTKYPYPECGYLVDERKFIFDNGSMDWDACNLKYERWAYFSDLRHKKEEPVSDVLEEAAKIYARGEYDRKNPSSLPWQCKGCYSPLIYAFKDGAQWQKQQIMKDAVEVKVKVDAGGYPYVDRVVELYDYDKDIPLAKAGDKVKLIIIKE